MPFKCKIEWCIKMFIVRLNKIVSIFYDKLVNLVWNLWEINWWFWCMYKHNVMWTAVSRINFIWARGNKSFIGMHMTLGVGQWPWTFLQPRNDLNIENDKFNKFSIKSFLTLNVFAYIYNLLFIKMKLMLKLSKYWIKKES